MDKPARHPQLESKLWPFVHKAGTIDHRTTMSGVSIFRLWRFALANEALQQSILSFRVAEG